jgi:hypothetical protein
MSVYGWCRYQIGRSVCPLCRRDKHIAMVMLMRLNVISVIMAVVTVIVIVMGMVVVRMRMIVVEVSVWLDWAVRMPARAVRVAVPRLTSATGILHKAEPKPGDQQTAGNAQPAEHDLARQCRCPSASTPPVCVAVTVAPTMTASRTEPCRPAM